MHELPQTLSSQIVFEGLVFRVHIDQVRYADGSEHRFDVLDHHGAVGIIATLPDGRIVLVRQYRHPFGRMLWEIPAGRTERNESPADAALRELREETGYVAGRIQPVGSFAVTPGYCTEVIHLFHASALVAGEQSLDADERISIEAFTANQAEQLTRVGEIGDMKTAFALAWLRTA